MCDLCGPWYDDRPTRQELEAEALQERMDAVICDTCGEPWRYCNCEPGTCNCDPEEMEE